MYDFPFDQFVEPARQKPQLWRLFLGIGVLVFAYVGFMAIMVVALYPVVGPLEYFGWLSGVRQPATPAHVFFVLISFFGMAIGVILAAASCQGRGLGSLLGPAHKFVPDFLQTLMYLAPLYVLLGAYAWSSMDVAPNQPLKHWLILLPMALPPIFVQVTAEELIFRGYLPQQLAARFKASWVWLFVPAAIFAFLHFDPSIGPANVLIIGTIAIFALIAMDLTARRGNLGAAVALHFANNCFALLFVALDGTITGLALYVTPFDAENTSMMIRSAAIDIAVLFLIWKLLKTVLRG